MSATAVVDASPQARRHGVAFAALLTAIAPVVMGTLAGQHPVHILTVGALALAVGVVRVSMAGAYSGCFAAISGALVAQPALHAAAKLFPAPGHLTEASVTATQVAFAALVVAAVTAAQTLATAIGALLPWAFLFVLSAFQPRHVEAGVSPADAPSPYPVQKWLARAALRRGPPAAAASAC